MQGTQNKPCAAKFGWWLSRFVERKEVFDSSVVKEDTPREALLAPFQFSSC